jgi:HD superfamily phosphohydrolase
MRGPKWVPWPGIGQIDIRPISPIVDDNYFRRLSDKKQLGFSYLVFPGAIYDRRQHAMGAYVLTRKFTSRMVERKLLTADEATNLSLFALLHDIGHGPFSHVIEPLTRINHEQYGLNVLGKLAREVQACGGNVKLIMDYMRKAEPAGKIVIDKNFGMDKLDYLVRDQEETAFGPNVRHCVESVFNYLVYRDGELLVDVKTLDAAVEIQRAYIYFYRNVHLEKSSYIVQRFMQKLMYQLLHAPKEEGGIAEEKLWEMVDGDVIYALKRCQNETVRNGMAVFDEGVKHFPKTALSVRMKGFEWLERTRGKPIKVIGMGKDFFDKFFLKSGPADLEQIETEVAETLGVESWEVAVSHIVEKDRFIPQDIKLYDGPKVYSLKEQDPCYFGLLEEELKKYLCVRICVVPEHRHALFERWNEAFGILCRHIGYGPFSL